MSLKKTKTGPEQLRAAPIDRPPETSLISRLRLEILIIMLAGAYILWGLFGGALSAAIDSVARDTSGHWKTCVVPAGGSNATDDGPAIREAFEKCGQNGNVVFLNTTYYVNSVLNTSGLSNCQVDIHGTLLASCSLHL